MTDLTEFNRRLLGNPFKLVPAEPLKASPETRKLREDLTPQELFRLEEYGSIHFESAGAVRKK